ncbi:MAG: Alkaline phosphatase [Paenibacillaceae bacterium]|nr:Alkaline phosphatase [Paenibacillaceae bacterium]
MNKFAKLIVISGLTLALIPAAGVNFTAVAAEASATAPASKNLIVLIGDGMGPAQVTAGRNYLKYIKGTDHLELDKYYVGQATTFADRGEDGGVIVSGIVTDSASAGTAFATGNKTYNAGISVSNEDISVPYASVIEAAEKAGKATGLVTTARITHATPAVYGSHVRSRDNESAIASQYLDSGIDVLFGGGKQFFVTKDEKGKRADKNIIGDFEAKGYKVAYDAAALNGLTGSKALGLFNSSHVDYTLDRTSSVPSLAAMTSKALDILSAGDNGFAIMIEGGRIDHASHANDYPSTIQEVLDFDAAVKVAMEFAKADGNTSVVITADHETGGLSLARDNIYEMNYDLWDKQKKSSEILGIALKAATTAAEINKIVTDNTWITDLTNEEISYIMAGDGSSYGREGAFNAVVSKRLLIGWSGHGHSGVDVGVWAYGPIADIVTGQVDNTDIAKASAKVLGLDLDAASKELQAANIYPKFKINRSNEVLYPAKALSDKLGITSSYDEATRSVTLSGASGSLVVNVDSKTAQWNGAASAFTTDIDNGKLYLPLAAFNQLTGKAMTWDSLSERINLQ